MGALALLSKDLQRLGSLLPGLVLLTVLSVALYTLLLLKSESLLSYFILTSLFSYPVLPIIALLLGHHLIVQEYYSHTHRYIEALPLSRNLIAGMKFLLGFSILLGLTLMVWLFSYQMASQYELINNVATMLISLVVYVLTIWSLVFFYSFLGRFRIPIICVCLSVLIWLDQTTGFELSRSGPLALIDQDLFAHQSTLPIRQLFECLLIIALSTVAAYFLIRNRNGSLAEKLAIPMSWAEKTLLVLLASAGTLAYVGLDSEVSEIEPLVGTTYTLDQPPVQIAYLEPRFESDAQQVIGSIQPMLQSLGQLLDHPFEQFKVRLSLSPARLSKNYHTEASSQQYGILIAANFQQTEAWPKHFFAAFTLHEYLVALTNHRATLEPNHWLLDGFAYWWAQRHNVLAIHQTSTDSLDPGMLLAIYASRTVNPNALNLRNWDQSAEALGDNLSMALAYSAWRSIELTQGTDAAINLAKMEFSHQPYGDVRDWWFEITHPLESRFEAATGLPYLTFVENWHHHLTELAETPVYKAALEKLPSGKFQITTARTENGFNDVNFEFVSNKPLVGHSNCKIQHAILPHFDPPYYELSIKKEDINPQYGVMRMRHTVSANYTLGTRIYGAMECELNGFELPLRLGSVRQVLE